MKTSNLKYWLPLLSLPVFLTSCATAPSGPYGAYGSYGGGNNVAQSLLSTALSVGTSALAGGSSSGLANSAISSVGGQLVNALTSRGGQYQYAGYRQAPNPYGGYTPPPRQPVYPYGGYQGSPAQYYPQQQQPAPQYWGY